MLFIVFSSPSLQVITSKLLICYGLENQIIKIIKISHKNNMSFNIQTLWIIWVAQRHFLKIYSKFLGCVRFDKTISLLLDKWGIIVHKYLNKFIWILTKDITKLSIIAFLNKIFHNFKVTLGSSFFSPKNEHKQISYR